MIVFQDILRRLSDCGWSSYRLIKEKKISNGTIVRLRSGQSVSTETINIVCRLCGCQPGDLMKYEPDPEEGER